MEIETKNFDVSVILSIFNSRKFYKRALDSVLNQTFSNFELIIVDDGSTDIIESELLPMIKQHDNIKYLRHSNRKHPLTLNTGILISSGNYLSFLDSDDEYEKKFLQERVNYFTDNPETDLIYSPATIIGDKNDLFVPDAKDTSKLIHIEDCIIGGTLFGKKKVFIKLNGFKNIYSHDSDFFERACRKFNVERYDSRSYIYYRNNPDSVINKLKSQRN